MPRRSPRSGRFLSVLDLPPVGEMGLVARLQLVLEVARDYPSLARAVRANDLTEMARLARAPGRGAARVPAEDAHETAVRLGHAVMQTLRVLPADARCLVRSLIVMRMMTRRSIPGVLVLGVRSEGRFEAHAWVEHDAQPVIPATGFERLVEL